MSLLLQRLQQASKSLNSAGEPADMLGLLLSELNHLCRADLVLLFRPVTPQRWCALQSSPAESLPAFANLIEISLDPLDEISGLRTALDTVLQQRKGLCCADPVRAGEFNFTHLRPLELAREQRITASMLVPLTGPDGGSGGTIELLRFETPCADAFSDDELIAATILVQQASAGLRQLSSRRESNGLFEALIQLIASAIDEKSPFAGDHCRRVPVLTILLAQAVARSEDVAFKLINFSAEELYELEVAAWLHDIGKLMTPIHISDKATKLERTIDRFDLVRTRFEIVRRDLEIARLRGGDSTVDIEIPETEAELGQTLDDLRFLADCNRGRKSLGAQEMARVRKISQAYGWIDRQGERMPVLTDDEAANLMVLRGTITDEEREMINHHVVSTIHMLDMLPFPGDLSRVPEIAGSHHENYNGRGFPSGLTGQQMSIQARILGFADLFESVSAGSRPYKTRNSLNQALQILRSMVDEGQADPHLFRLFVAEGLYEGYAHDFLMSDQIDSVDRSALLEGLSFRG